MNCWKQTVCRRVHLEQTMPRSPLQRALGLRPPGLAQEMSHLPAQRPLFVGGGWRLPGAPPARGDGMIGRHQHTLQADVFSGKDASVWETVVWSAVYYSLLPEGATAFQAHSSTPDSAKGQMKWSGDSAMCKICPSFSGEVIPCLSLTVLDTCRCRQ